MKAVLSVTFLFAASLPLAAQFNGPLRGGEHGGGFGLGRKEVVTGAPFTATVTNSMVQPLAGGNSIQKTSTGQIARDAVGRTYERQTITGGPFSSESKTLIFITDPVLGYSYVLNATNNTAMRRPFHAWTGGSGTEGRPPQEQDVVIDLGQDKSSGVVANGTKVTRTIPAGQIGNAAPISTTFQKWYSPDLKLVVKSVRNDPRFGESIYALSGIVRGDPDPALFEIPSTYKIVDASEFGRHRLGPGK